MEKKIITFSANEQQLIKTGGINCYASNIVAYIEAQFDLGANWQGFDSVRAVWYTGYVKGISTVLDSNGRCIAPYEVLTHKGDVMVNLVGSISDGETLTDRLTTCPVTAVEIKCNARIDTDNSKSITPSEYEQFVANVKADADRAEAGATASANSAQSSSESATASANSASDSAQSATASAQSAQNASESAISAESAKDDAEDARDKILGMRATAETLEAGSDATASYSDGVLTLGIPRGDKGEQGIQGETGATPNFSIGEVDTLEPNESATATITGTAENPVLNLGIPKGEQGDVSLEQLEALLPTETASGDIVTITDGQSVVPAKSLKVALEPIQDLNGYDKPWAGGSGKNKCGALESGTWRESSSVGSDYDSMKAINDGRGRSVNLVPVTVPMTISIASGYQYALIVFDAEQKYLGSSSFKSFRSSVYTESTQWYEDGRYIAFAIKRDDNQALTNDDLGNCHLQLELGATATSYEPYSNICPISGHTEVNTHRTGKNLWDAEAIVESSGHSSNCFIEDGYLKYKTGNATTNGMIWDDLTIPCPCTLSGTIKNFGSSNNLVRFKATFDDGTTQTNIINSTLTANESKKVSATIGSAGRTLVELRNDWTSGLQAGLDLSDTQLEVSSTATDFEPYQGHTYTTSLGQTVYGGTLDVVSGELVVDRAMVDLGSLTWANSGANKLFYTPDLNESIRRATSNTEVASWLMDSIGFTKTNYDRIGTSRSYEVCVSVGGSILATLDTSRIYTSAEFKTAMNGVQLVYELANPQTIQLSAQEVELLTGTNNVWSDGNVTLVYSADIQRYIEKKLGTRATLTMSRPTVDTEQV